MFDKLTALNSAAASFTEGIVAVKSMDVLGHFDGGFRMKGGPVHNMCSSAGFSSVLT